MVGIGGLLKGEILVRVQGWPLENTPIRVKTENVLQFGGLFWGRVLNLDVLPQSVLAITFCRQKNSVNVNASYLAVHGARAENLVFA